MTVLDLAVPLVIIAISAALIYWLILRRKRPTRKAD